MIKTFCDKCEKEIKSGDYPEHVHVGTVYGKTKEYIVCKNCYNKIILFIEKL